MHCALLQQEVVMLKKMLVIFLACLMAVSLFACEGEVEVDSDGSSSDVNGDETQTGGSSDNADVKGPEELTMDFLRAVYMGDLDAFFAHIPEFTYDVLLSSEDIAAQEGADKGDLIYNYFKSIMEEEPEEAATEVTIETKISDTLTMQTYFDTLRKYYLPKGFISEADLEKLQDVVYVSFNADVKYGSGRELSLTDFKAAIPCVKIEGKWYVDYFYLVMIPVSSKGEEKPAVSTN